MKLRLAVALSFVLAAGLRITRLDERPMHADEAVLADKLGTLVETGAWQYDPTDYHGPVLPYLSAVAARLSGAHRYRDFTETMLRIIPALIGLTLVLMPILLKRWLGWPGAVAASILTCVSPAMVYYSRYYIPEMLLICFTGGLIVAWCRYRSERSVGWMLCAGLLAGLMCATKETGPIAIGCMILAAGLTEKRLPDWRHMLLGLVVALVIIFGFLGWPALQAFGTYLHRAVGDQRHVHPWYYYLRLLLYHPGPGGFFWSEGLILALAALGAVAAFLREESDGVGRLLVVYTLSMTACYSLIPYKTPWCLLGFLYGMILLAGLGAAFLLRMKSRAVKAAVVVCLAHLLYQAVVTSRTYSSDPRNPYAYAHTTTDVCVIRDRLERLAAADPQGRAMRVQILSRENLWPLPWYLRAFPHVEWWRGVVDEMQPASVIIVSPDMEAALTHRLYEVPPPGKRPLYVSMFRREIELRPGVELRGYVRQDLWNASDR